MINNVRGTSRLAIPSGVQCHPSGAPGFALQRLHLSQFTGYDPNSRLASAASDGGEGSGWSVSLTGGLAAISDPFDGAYWIGSMSSIFGTKLADTDLMWSLQTQAIERTNPGLSTSYNVMMGVCNEATDSATIDAVLAGMRYNASRVAISANVPDGVGSINASGNASNMRGWFNFFQKHGLGPGRVAQAPQFAAESSLLPVNTTITAGTGAVNGFGDAEPYLVIAVFRHATTAGTATGAYDFYAGLGTSWRAAT